MIWPTCSTGTRLTLSQWGGGGGLSLAHKDYITDGWALVAQSLPFVACVSSKKAVGGNGQVDLLAKHTQNRGGRAWGGRVSWGLKEAGTVIPSHGISVIEL